MVKAMAVAGLALSKLVLFPWLSRGLLLNHLTRPAFISGALALLAGSAGLGLWASYDLSLSLPLFFTLLGSIALFFAIVNTRTLPSQIGGGLVAVAALFAGYFVSQYGHFVYPTEIGRLANLGRATGSLLPDLVFFTPHPNAAAGFLEGTLFLSLVLAWRAQGGKRIVWSLLVGLILYGLLISQSRGAWIGLAVAGIFWGVGFIPNRRWRQNIIGAALVVAVAALSVLAWLIWRGLSLLAIISPLESAISRLTLYRNSLYLWGDYPLTGIGLGDTFAMVYSRYQLLLHVPYLTYSHNMFLSVAVGLGVLGLMALVWLLLSFYTFVIRVERAGLSEPDHTLFRAAWLGVTVTFVHGLIDSPQFAGSGWTMPMLFGLLGLTVAIGHQALVDNKDQKLKKKLLGLPRPIRLLAVGVLVVVVGLTALGLWRPFLSAWYVNLGALAQTRADLTPDLDASVREYWTRQAGANFNEALRLEPLQPAANRRLGLMAFGQENYETAIVYLKLAHQQEPANQGTTKALGYAYMWMGQLDKAEKLLRQVDDRKQLIHELSDWSHWWNTQEQANLSTYAAKIARRLAATP